MPRQPATVARKKASQERSRATVKALLDATARVLVRDGYDRASTNKIAIAAGVSIGSLYQYFPTKEALVAAVMERHTEETMQLVRDSLVKAAGLSMPEAVREIIRIMIEAHRLDPKLHRVLVEQIPRVGNMDHLDRIDQEAMTLVRAYFAAHAGEVHVENPEMAAFVVVTTVEAMTHIAVLRRPDLLADPDFVDEVTALVVRYLRGDPAKLPRR